MSGCPPSAPIPGRAHRPLIAVVGPTASGKSAWGLALAEALDGEIIGADSRQVYRGLDIGTAKPSATDRARVPHHCLDHVDPRERYHLARFLREAREAIDRIRARDRQPMVVGGTGQYVWALLEGWQVPDAPPDPAFRAEMAARVEREGAATLHAELAAVDPTAAQRILPGNVRRIVRALEVRRKTGRPISAWQEARAPIPAVVVAPLVERAALDARIAARVDAMFAAGLAAEVEGLLAAGTPRSAPGLGSIGYREVSAYIAGELSLEEAIAAVKRATRQLARRQAAWFRRDDPRIGWRRTLDEARAVVSVP